MGKKNKITDRDLSYGSAMMFGSFLMRASKLFGYIPQIFSSEVGLHTLTLDWIQELQRPKVVLGDIRELAFKDMKDEEIVDAIRNRLLAYKTVEPDAEDKVFAGVTFVISKRGDITVDNWHGNSTEMAKDLKKEWMATKNMIENAYAQLKQLRVVEKKKRILKSFGAGDELVGAGKKLIRGD